MTIAYVYDDGGRGDAGYRGEAGDCACRAIAIAAGLPYQDVYELLNRAAGRERRKRGRSSARNGVYRPTLKRVMAELGAEWTPTMSIGSGCTVHLRSDELPSGRLIVSLSRHVAAVIDGELRDTSRCDRDGTRCVYGYWRVPWIGTA